ncbi:MAG: Stp1/IreP family PP2C-type Ser/Thr phosphatase [Clostridia bacterium]|nr:Stp1/IreP family PP2C-type Ser/Thr phosphatase [Clostridia bacterium]
MKACALTDVGVTRSVNQDFVFYSTSPVGNLPNLFILADGMGGHKAGDMASRYTVETLVDLVTNAEEKDPISIINNGIQRVNSDILNKAKESEDYNGMGTTLVVSCIKDSILHVANVGDSRLYILDGDLKQVTRDHSLVEEMVTRGAIDRKSARHHEQKNMITRAIGGDDSVLPDFFPVDIKPGNKVLMCSDGLTNMVEDAVIEKILKNTQDIEEAARMLVDLANDNGGRDNVSVIIIEY